MCAILSWLIFQGQVPYRTLTCDGAVVGMRFSPDGRTLAAVVRGKGLVLWDTQGWKPRYTLSGAFGHVYFLPDSRTFVTISNHGGPGAEAVNQGEGLTRAQWERYKNDIHVRLQRWDTSSGRAIATFTLPLSSDEAAAPAANLIVFQRLVTPTGISVVDIRDGHEVHFIPGGYALSDAISPDGRWLTVVSLTARHTIFTLWDTQTWRQKSLQTVGEVETAQFSPDGRWFAVASSPAVSLWRVEGWQPGPRLITGYNNTCCLGFTLDSKQLIAGGAWKKTGQRPFHSALTIWDVAIGRKTAVLDNQDQAFWRVTCRGVLTHDILNQSKNVLWDTWTGNRLWQGPVTYEPDAAISPNGRMLLTSRNSGSHPLTDPGIIEVRHLPRF